jgi:heptosyltransferase-2
MRLPSPSSCTDLIWIQTSFLGDIILSTAGFEAAAGLMPHVRQHLITNALGANALKGHPSLASIHIFDKKKFILSSCGDVKGALQLGRAPVCLRPHRSVRSAILSKFLGIPSITYRESSLSILSDETVPRISVMHESLRTALLLEPFGWSRLQIASHAVPKLEVSANKPSHLPDKKIGPWIALAPGSVWGTKRWPYYGELAASILKQHEDCTLFLVGGPEEKDICLEVEKKAGSDPRLINLAGQTSLDHLRAFYPTVDLLVSNDSSPIHYASAFNIPTIAIFGPTVPAFGFGPLAKGSTILEHPLSCRPCSDHGPMACPLGHFKCMKDISTDIVLNKITSILNN